MITREVPVPRLVPGVSKTGNTGLFDLNRSLQHLPNGLILREPLTQAEVDRIYTDFFFSRIVSGELTKKSVAELRQGWETKCLSWFGDALPKGEITVALMYPGEVQDDDLVFEAMNRGKLSFIRQTGMKNGFVVGKWKFNEERTHATATVMKQVQ